MENWIPFLIIVPSGIIVIGGFLFLLIREWHIQDKKEADKYGLTIEEYRKMKQEEERKKEEEERTFLILDKMERLETKGMAYYGSGFVNSVECYYFICENCTTKTRQKIKVSENTYYNYEIGEIIIFEK
jgi:hypothetical protein